MFDFQAHILPNVDDGSQSIEESILMLQMLREQGCEVVVATPHFIADNDTSEAFFERRLKAYEVLKAELTKQEQSFPEILSGAEVYYYPGISRMSELSSFCLENSKLLLLEMPVSKWNEYMIRELIEMTYIGNIQVVLAHFERYLDMQNKDIWQKLIYNGILLQSNASFFLNSRTKRKALKLLEKGRIHFIGSDCHNIKHRPPRIGDAVSVIQDKMGIEFVGEWERFQKTFFNTKI